MVHIPASTARIPPKVYGRVAHRGERVRIDRRGDTPVYLINEEDMRKLEALSGEPKDDGNWPKGFFDKIHVRDPSFARPPQGKTPPIRSW